MVEGLPQNRLDFLVPVQFKHQSSFAAIVFYFPSLTPPLQLLAGGGVGVMLREIALKWIPSHVQKNEKPGALAKQGGNMNQPDSSSSTAPAAAQAAAAEM
ncbi:hypothetical protein CDAR_484041 [Caerostris darwini]|uniref:Uncharacterized protein n=1 Tax=Caerostris darwini TaxID=1538125 RepID=A0AAV4TAM3_9ARAC|nr:hypothetical protein CDAR_484041 [Caerostris darwini]